MHRRSPAKLPRSARVDDMRVIPAIAHRGAGITAPTKTQAAVPDETLAMPLVGRSIVLLSACSCRGRRATRVPSIPCASQAPVVWRDPLVQGHMILEFARCVAGGRLESSHGPTFK